MSFLSGIVDRIFGKKDNDKSQTNAVVDPVNSSTPALKVQKAPSLELSAPPPVSNISPVSLVKAQTPQPQIQAPPPVPQNPIPVIGAAPSPEMPEPGLLQKVGNYLGDQASFAVQHPISAIKNVGSAIVSAPQVQGFANEIAAPFVQNIYQKQNEEDQARANEGDAKILAAARLQQDPVKKAHLLSLIKPSEQLDYNNIAGLNDTAEQVLGNAGGVGLDVLALPALFSGLIPGAVKAGTGELAADSLLKATAKNVGVGSIYGADQAASSNVTDPLQFAEQTAIGGGTGGAFSLAASGLGKLLSLFRGDPVLPGTPPKVGGAIPDSLSPDGNLTPGTYNSFPTENPNLEVPTIQRNQEAAMAANQLKKAEVPGDRSLADLNGKTLSPQDVQNFDPLGAGMDQPLQKQPNIRPVGQEISKPSQTIPDEQIKKMVAERGVLKNVEFSDKPLLEPGTGDPAPFATDPATRTLKVDKTVFEDDLNHLEQGGKFQVGLNEGQVFEKFPGESRQQLAERYLKEAVLPYEENHVSNMTVEQADRRASGEGNQVARELDIKSSQQVADAAKPPVVAATPVDEVKAPRQAQILLDKEANGADKEAIRSSLPRKEKASLDVLQARGTQQTASLGDEGSIAKAYFNEPAINNPQDYYAALEAAKRLSGLTDEASVNARSNIYNAMVNYSSNSGLGLRSTQVLWNDMPVEMKISTTLKGIVKTLESRFGADSPEVTKLTDPALRSSLESELSQIFTTEQSIKDQMAVSQGLIESVKEAPSNYSKEQIAQAGSDIATGKEKLSENAGKFASFRDNLVPHKADIADKIGDFQRTSMLSSITSGVRDLIQTPLTALHKVLDTQVEGGIGRVLNKVTGKEGEFLDRGISPTKIVSETSSALKKAGQNVTKGDTYGSIEDVQKNIKRTPDKTDLSGNSKNIITKLVKAKTNLANDAVAGLKTGEIERLARQEGQKAGFKGLDLENYVEASKVSPTPEMARKAQTVQDAVNNINDNPITSALRKVNSAFSELGKPGKFIANALDPFPTWAGGNVWNSITDRNVIANTIKFAANIGKNPQEAVSQLSKALVGTGELFGAGYLLSKTGVITDKDANGDSYEGLYFHVGNKYIPISAAGAVAPNIILGHALESAFNGDEGNVVDKLAATISQSFKSLNISNITGGNSYLLKTLDQAAKDPVQAASTAASGFAGQFIPAVGGDINSVLNQTDLNPTGEAADTKAVDLNSPSGEATDFVQTSINQVKNKIPFLSQGLPRKEGVASQDPLDRVFGGNHTSGAQAQAESDAKDQFAEAYKGLKEQGAFTPSMRKILDADNQKIYDKIAKGGTVSDKDLKKLTDGFTKNLTATGDSRFLEDGDYDSNLAALKIKRAQLASDPTNTEKELGEYDTQIKRGEVYQKNKTPYSLIEKHQKTSLSEWRDLGDSDSDTYNPTEYQKLYDLDQALAKAGASRNTDDKTQPFYTAKKAGKGSKNAALDKIKSNKIGSVVNLASVNLQKLQGKSTGTPAIPTVAPVKSSELVKKRKISVS